MALARAPRRAVMQVAGLLALAIALLPILGVARTVASLPILLLLAAGAAWLARPVLRRTRAALTLARLERQGRPTDRVERFRGTVPVQQYLRYTRLAGLRVRLEGDSTPRSVQLDVMQANGLVIAFGEPPIEVRPGYFAPIVSTSDQLGGTPRAERRALTPNERIELDDLVRQDSLWARALRMSPLALPVLGVAALLFGSRGLAMAVAACALVAIVVSARDVLLWLQRARDVRAAYESNTVEGAVDEAGKPLELLLPSRRLWTVDGRPAPDRLRPTSLALSRAVDAAESASVPTTF